MSKISWPNAPPHHPGTAALSLACRRSRWRRHRYPRPVASRLAEDLRRRGAVPKENGTSFVLYENVDPWPHAFVLDSAAEHMPRLRLPGCANDRLLCINLAPLAERRSTDGPLITHQNGRIDVRLSPAAESRLLVVSQMFRRDWVAFTDDSPLTTVPAFGGIDRSSCPAENQLHPASISRGHGDACDRPCVEHARCRFRRPGRSAQNRPAFRSWASWNDHR